MSTMLGGPVPCLVVTTITPKMAHILVLSLCYKSCTKDNVDCPIISWGMLTYLLPYAVMYNWLMSVFNEVKLPFIDNGIHNAVLVWKIVVF